MRYYIPLARTFGSKFQECWSGGPPPPQWKLGQDLTLGIWVGLEYPPPNENENLARLRNFGFELVWRTKHFCGSWCVETNRCIPQGYRLVLSVTLSYLIYNIKFCSTQSNYYIFGLNVFFERLLYFKWCSSRQTSIIPGHNYAQTQFSEWEFSLGDRVETS